MSDAFVKNRFKYEGTIQSKDTKGSIEMFYDTGSAYTTVARRYLNRYLGREVDLSQYADVILVGYIGKDNYRIGKLVCLHNVVVLGTVINKFFIVVMDDEVNGNLLGCDFISACVSEITADKITSKDFNESAYLENIKALLETNDKLDLYFNGYLDTCCLNPPKDTPIYKGTSLGRLSRMAAENK